MKASHTIALLTVAAPLMAALAIAAPDTTSQKAPATSQAAQIPPQPTVVFPRLQDRLLVLGIAAVTLGGAGYIISRLRREVDKQQSEPG